MHRSSKSVTSMHHPFSPLELKSLFLDLNSVHLPLALINDVFKSLRVVHSQVGENLSVEGDVAFAQLMHQPGVGGSVLAGGGVDAGDPQAAEGSFFISPVAVGVLECFFNGVFGNGVHFGAGTEVAFGEF